MNTARLLVATLAAALIAGCGGGTGGTGLTSGGTGTPNTLSVGVNKQTAGVFVNGVTFNAAGASITIDNIQGKAVGDLQNGMVLTVRGRINSDGVTGVAQQVEAEIEVRGTVQAVDSTAQSFRVLDQTVFVDDQTVFANVSGFGGLAQGSSVVEVSGLRDASGNIRGTRVELVSSVANPDELRGSINNLAGSMFTLNGVGVDASNAFIAPTGSSISDLRNGEPVEVHGSFNGSIFVAAQVDREDLEDAQFEPGNNDAVHVEGYVSDLTVTTSITFLIGGQFVSATANTNFQNGAGTDLADNVEVEVEGHISNGVLVADMIAFERARVILIGVGSVTGTVPGTGTLTVFGKNVVVNSLTQGNPVANGQRVEVHGFVDVNGNIVAETVAPASGGGGGGGGKDVVQAPVTAIGASSVTMLGTIVADLSSSTIQLSGPNGPLPTLAAFLGLISAQSSSAPGTLVKVSGTFDGTSTIAVEEAEIED